ncbi:MAG: DUF3426 domain-containing protein [Pseudomonadota bacterium]
MIVQCQKCQTKFRMDEAKIPEAGSWVRCGKCQDVFQVLPPGAAPVEPPRDQGLELDRGTPRQSRAAEEAADFGLDLDAPSPRKRGKAKSKGRGRGFKVIFWMLAILLLLAIVAAGGLVALDRLGLSPRLVDRFRSVPVLSLLLSPGGAGKAAKPAAEAEYQGLLLSQVRGYFRVNQAAGRLFIIQGLVENQGQQERAAVMVRGRLTDTQGQVARQEVIYAGQAFNPDELQQMPLAELQARLSKPDAPGGGKHAVKPGATLPFMIVFANLPTNLAEFTAEVVGSEAAAPPPAGR